MSLTSSFFLVHPAHLWDGDEDAREGPPSPLHASLITSHVAKMHTANHMHSYIPPQPILNTIMPLPPSERPRKMFDLFPPLSFCLFRASWRCERKMVGSWSLCENEWVNENREIKGILLCPLYTLNLFWLLVKGSVKISLHFSSIQHYPINGSVYEVSKDLKKIWQSAY